MVVGASRGFANSLCFMVSSFFCLHRYADPRDLHSFPTRRSSDLTSSQVQRTRRGCRYPPAGLSLPALPRSEEHTSELQSRENLVCRLLLEKKKARNSSRAVLHQEAWFAAGATSAAGATGSSLRKS